MGAVLVCFPRIKVGLAPERSDRAMKDEEGFVKNSQGKQRIEEGGLERKWVNQ